jgi:hypothetical protein
MSGTQNPNFGNCDCRHEGRITKNFGFRISDFELRISICRLSLGDSLSREQGVLSRAQSEQGFQSLPLEALKMVGTPRFELGTSRTPIKRDA